MPYDPEFYRMYREYLEEPTVRLNHNHAFALFASLLPSLALPRVVDLGCGVGEYERYDPYHVSYVGIDLNRTGDVSSFLEADYTKFGLVEHLPFAPNGFVSLFSIECFHPAGRRYEIYEQVFDELPTVKAGLVSGFFYDSRRALEAVEETGQIVSYQTVEDPADFVSHTFTELRIHMRTPSQMFGPDVVEVWKIFVRK